MTGERCLASYRGKRCGLDAGHHGTHVHYFDPSGEMAWSDLVSDPSPAPAEPFPMITRSGTAALGGGR